MRIKAHALTVFFILLFSNTAFAHSPIKGIGNFYNGLLHPILVPAHIILIIAVGLFFGQQGHKKIEATIGLFALATFIGLISAWFSINLEIEAVITTLSATTGLIIALNPSINLVGCLIIISTAGFLLGIDSTQETLVGKEKLMTLFGSGVAIYFLFLYSMVIAQSLNKKAWQKIGIRIFGSWIAASSLLVLALSFSPKIT